MSQSLKEIEEKINFLEENLKRMKACIPYCKKEKLDEFVDFIENHEKELNEKKEKFKNLKN